MGKNSPNFLRIYLPWNKVTTSAQAKVELGAYVNPDFPRSDDA